MDENKLPQEIISLLETACEDNINNYEIVVHDSKGFGHGFIGELMYISLENKSTKKSLHLVVKQPFPSTDASNKAFSERFFFNEIYFYKNIWAEIEKFQKSFPRAQQFDKIPKFYCSIDVPSQEKLVIENLRYSGFQMFPRDVVYDDLTVQLLMRSYGQFHGASAAFREHNPAEYEKLTTHHDFTYATEAGLKTNFLYNFIMNGVKQMYEKETNSLIKDKLKIYSEKGIDIAVELLKYDGKNPIINHGDCWNNNILCKFDENGIPTDIRLIDFQLCRSASAVLDLSFLLYSGATKDVLENLDHYLKTYYDSFSDTIRSYDLDPSKVFSFDDLKSEWKRYCPYGFVMSQMVWGTKLAKSYHKRSLVDIMGGDNMKNAESVDFSEFNKERQTDEEKLTDIRSALVRHMYENDYL